MKTIPVKIKLAHPLAKVPTYGTEQAACFDISCIDEGAPHPVDPHARIYRTGLHVEVEPGWVLKVYSRSGHGFKSGWCLSNGTGIIDADYRGELMIAVRGLEGSVPSFKAGDRIAQGSVEQVPRVEFIQVDELSDTARGAGGFGSTGTKAVG